MEDSCNQIARKLGGIPSACPSLLDRRELSVFVRSICRISAHQKRRSSKEADEYNDENSSAELGMTYRLKKWPRNSSWKNGERWLSRGRVTHLKDASGHVDRPARDRRKHNFNVNATWLHNIVARDGADAFVAKRMHFFQFPYANRSARIPEELSSGNVLGRFAPRRFAAPRHFVRIMYGAKRGTIKAIA